MNLTTNKADGAPARGVFYWIIALTFAWAIAGPFGIRYFIGWSKLLVYYFYPSVCFVAGVILLIRGHSRVFAVLNLLCGIAWVVFIAFVLRAVDQGFSRS